jgi:hypothetical protein
MVATENFLLENIKFANQASHYQPPLRRKVGEPLF